MPLCTLYPDERIPARCFWGSTVYVNLMPELSKTPGHQVVITSVISYTCAFPYLHLHLDCHSAFPKSHTGAFPSLQSGKPRLEGTQIPIRLTNLMHVQLNVQLNAYIPSNSPCSDQCSSTTAKTNINVGIVTLTTGPNMSVIQIGTQIDKNMMYISCR